MNRLMTYLRESRAELAKVDWPNRQQAMRLTAVVVVFSLLVASFIGAVDYIFTTILQKVILKG
ncbi:MAG TPA: preprotein translocase subunit SecE [Candidatus Saccharimonadales bacterium]|nr:preprotein translocase subunit SecE [Candidatus Saccharimonadales bacterium]